VRKRTKGEISSARAGKDESRQEALKRFGRYAAVAPATMVLLQSHRGETAPPPHASPAAAGSEKSTLQPLRLRGLTGPSQEAAEVGGRDRAGQESDLIQPSPTLRSVL
jgi:hypothetical protein